LKRDYKRYIKESDFVVKDDRYNDIPLTVV